MADQIRPGVYFLDDAPDFVLQDGLVRIRSRSGGVEFDMVCTINQFYRGTERARRLCSEIDGSGSVVPFKEPGEH